MRRIDQRGAEWIAHELQRIGATEPDPVRATCQMGGDPCESPRWPLTEHMDDASRVEWWMVMRDAGLV